MNSIICERTYDSDLQKGYRILTDRLWPRGIKKEDLHFDIWSKEIAPTSEIRKEFGHKEENFEKFKSLYIKELNSNPESRVFLELVSEKLKKENVILLYAAKNTVYNHAVVLKSWLEERIF
jgi:uncharacterized protein YeaO (DUF488 family)